MTENQPRTRLLVPGSIRLLTAEGVRGNSTVFSLILIFLFAVASASQFVGAGLAWTLIFLVGASSAGTYLVLTAFSLFERTRSLIIRSTMKARVLVLGICFACIITSLSVWVSQSGSVEALPFFPVLIGIFYAWVLLQSYFIATPDSHILTKVESVLSRDGSVRRAVRGLGVASVLIPILPIAYGV